MSAVFGGGGMTAREVLVARREPLGLVIFDCDGVLVDSEPVANRVVSEFVTAAGWAMTAAACEERFIGLNLEAMVPLIEAELGRALPGDWVMQLTERLVEVLEVESVPIWGAIGALRGVTGLGLPWRVASNSSHQEMRAKFGCIGIGDLVAGRVHSYTDVAHGKPAPDLFLAAAAAEGVGPAACVVIEDSATGARAAAAAGMLCLGYAPEGDGARLRSEGAYLFGNMGELPELIAVTIR